MQILTPKDAAGNSVVNHLAGIQQVSPWMLTTFRQDRTRLSCLGLLNYSPIRSTSLAVELWLPVLQVDFRFLPTQMQAPEAISGWVFLYYQRRIHIVVREEGWECGGMALEVYHSILAKRLRRLASNKHNELLKNSKGIAKFQNTLSTCPNRC